MRYPHSAKEDFLAIIINDYVFERINAELDFRICNLNLISTEILVEISERSSCNLLSEVFHDVYKGFRTTFTHYFNIIMLLNPVDIFIDGSQKLILCPDSPQIEQPKLSIVHTTPHILYLIDTLIVPYKYIL